MEDNEKIQKIINKLSSGIKFGLFEGSQMSCYFRDGEKVSYNDLWKALRIIHNLGEGAHHKTIRELCPDLFEGAFTHKFSKHSWKKKTV